MEDILAKKSLQIHSRGAVTIVIVKQTPDTAQLLEACANTEEEPDRFCLYTINAYLAYSRVVEGF